MKPSLGGGDEPFIRPNVSHCVQDNEVYYNPIPETRVIATFNVTDASKMTQIIGCDGDMVHGLAYEKIECDGVDITNDIDTSSYDTATYLRYQLSEGKHTVKYTLTNLEDMVDGKGSYTPFAGCTEMTEIYLPSTLKKINWWCFNGCTSLKEITIPENIETMGWFCFSQCNSLETVTVMAKTPPTGDESGDRYWFKNYQSGSGESIIPNLTSIYVPSDLVDTYKSASNWSYYADYIKPMP